MKTSHKFGIGFMSIIGLTFLTLIMGATVDEPSQEEAEAPPSLKETYQDAFRIGAALGSNYFDRRDTDAVAIIEEHFNTLTPENVMKPEPINPNPGEFNFGPADALVDAGEKDNMFIVGHTLVWHKQIPDWFFHDEQGNSLDRDAQIEQMRSHIEAVAGRYSGRIHAWDVVNEAFAEDGSLLPTPWLENIGEDYLELAFEFAHEYAPDAELYYNDYNVWRPEKRDGIMRLVRSLQKKDIRIDGVGMQAHWGLNYPKTEYIEAAIDSFATLGVKVMITEFDVDVLPLTKEAHISRSYGLHPKLAWLSQLEEFKEFLDPYAEGLPEDVEQELAERYAELFNIFYNKRDKIDRVTFWGVYDGSTWKNNAPIPDRTNYPLLFDRDYQPKPAFYEVVDIPSR